MFDLVLHLKWEKHIDWHLIRINLSTSHSPSSTHKIGNSKVGNLFITSYPSIGCTSIENCKRFAPANGVPEI